MSEVRGKFDETVAPQVWFCWSPNMKLSKAQQDHLNTLPPIPKQWRRRVEVFHPNGKVFWVAYDKNDQRHHMYTKDWHEQREHSKIVRVLRVMTRPGYQARMHRVVARDAKDASLRSLALATSILCQCPLRPGSNVSKNFGLTTLTNRHLHRNKLKFQGKSGQENVCHLNDATVRMLKRVGRNSTSRLLSISDADLRDYVQTNFGITTKDFRTMYANRTFFEMTRNLPATMTFTDRARAINIISNKVAAHLNNTSAVAKSSYISNVLQAALLLSPQTIRNARTLPDLLGLLETCSALTVLQGSVLQRALGKRVSTLTVNAVIVHM
jgi:DNA topoisomerase IB